MVCRSFAFFSAVSAAAAAGLGASNLDTYVDSLSLDFSFPPIKASYWTSYPHHRRTPFAVSSDGSKAFLAYLDGSGTDVHVQEVSTTDFTAVGSAVTISGGKEAGGLVAHSDGFALLTNEALPSGTENAPSDSTPVPVIYRYTNGEKTWKTFIGGPGVHASSGLADSPDINGDLVYSEEAELYGAYIVVTDYTGDAAGHYGDSIQYLDTNGTLETISGASSTFGCSHNTGIAFEAADSAPFASICAEDQGDIWLNTETQYMSGVKISNENTTNGGSGEPMGGMSGSYSGLARLVDSDEYVFAWVSRGAKDLTENTWMGDGYTQCTNRTNPRNVAIARFSDKNTLIGDQATSVVGAVDGDSQINWITNGTSDCSNAHVAAFNGESVLVSWEEIEDPECYYIAMGCKGTFSGASYQLVTNGEKVGEPIVKDDVYVAGDMVTMSDGRICWPYVSMTWSLSSEVYDDTATTTKKMSFACMSVNGSASSSGSSSSAVASASATATTSSSITSETAAAVISTSIAVSATTSAAVSSQIAAGVSTSSTQDTTPTTLSTLVVSATATTSTEPSVSTSASTVTVSAAEGSTSRTSAVTAQPTSGSHGGKGGKGHCHRRRREGPAARRST